MPRPKSSPYTVSWLLRLEPDMAEEIDERREKTGLSRAETIRRMLRWALSQPEKRVTKKMGEH